MKHLRLVLALAAITFGPTAADAVPFTVDAFANSRGGTGVGLPSIFLTAGQMFSVVVDPDDLWSAGPPPPLVRCGRTDGAPVCDRQR